MNVFDLGFSANRFRYSFKFKVLIELNDVCGLIFMSHEVFYNEVEP